MDYNADEIRVPEDWVEVTGHIKGITSGGRCEPSTPLRNVGTSGQMPVDAPAMNGM